MSWRTRLGFAPKPQVAFSPFGVDNLPPEMREGMTMGGALAPRISRAEALQVPAVLRSRNLIAGTLGGLPLHLRNPRREIVSGSEAPTSLFDQIDPDCANVVVMAQTYEDLLFEAESWWRVLERNAAGWPTFAEHIDWRRVRVDENAAIVYIDGYPVADNGVIRFESPNPPLLVHAARAIRTCLVLDQTASGYASSPMPLGIFTPREGRRVNEDDQAIEDFLDKWEEARRRRIWGFVPSAVEAKTLQFNAEQIQLADQRQHAVLEIARASGVDPEMLGVSTTSRTYQNAEQQRMNLIDFTMAPFLHAVEERLSMGDVTPRGWRVKSNLDAFLRSDTKTRMETYAVGEPLGIYPPERLAELEDIPRVVKPKPPVEIPQNTRSVPQNDGQRRLEVVDEQTGS